MDRYLQWIPYGQLTNIRESPLLEHGCSHTADWLQLTSAAQMTKGIMLKKIVDGSKAQSFDFFKVCNAIFILIA